MYYPIIPQHIPQERRAEVNEKILFVDGRRIRIINEPMLRKVSKFG